MNRRVNGLGVSEAEVQTQGIDNIIVNIPKGTNSEQAREQVGTTAKLYFRPGARPGGHRLRRRPRPARPRAARERASAPRRAPRPRRPKATSSSSALGLRHHAGPRRHRRPEGRRHAVRLRPAPPSAAQPVSPARAASTASDRGHRQAPGQVRRARLHRPEARRARSPARAPSPTDPTVACGEIDRSGRSTCSARPRSTARTSRRPRPPSTRSAPPAGRSHMDFTEHGRQEVRRHHRQARAEPAAAEPVRHRPRRPGRLGTRGASADHRAASAEISGSFTQERAPGPGQRAEVRRAAADLPGADVTTVTAALGGDQLHAGLLAGAIGLALVVIYLLSTTAAWRSSRSLSLRGLGDPHLRVMVLLGPAIGFALNLPASRCDRRDRHHRGLVHRLLRTHP